MPCFFLGDWLTADNFHIFTDHGHLLASSAVRDNAERKGPTFPHHCFIIDLSNDPKRAHKVSQPASLEYSFINSHVRGSGVKLDVVGWCTIPVPPDGRCIVCRPALNLRAASPRDGSSLFFCASFLHTALWAGTAASPYWANWRSHVGGLWRFVGTP